HLLQRHDLAEARGERLLRLGRRCRRLTLLRVGGERQADGKGGGGEKLHGRISTVSELDCKQIAGVVSADAPPPAWSVARGLAPWSFPARKKRGGWSAGRRWRGCRTRPVARLAAGP